ncbi:D-lyxose/D-mannose family sugar isomerase [uncultured Robinsoniella sp.]|uniref:D-lyxose/D-mannose family sugar isomerase n=1 Tax=Robinsoniella sp. TaxID=2496533 RepID=UPI00374ECB51
MKRSEVNNIIEYAIALTEKRDLPLPPFAKWGPKEWKRAGENERELMDNMLGWDITDFGSGDFEKIGLTIFTFRNGSFLDKETYPKPYAEKLLLVRDGQILPYHFHWSKMEDIINRGGGDLVLKLYNSDESEAFADTDVLVAVDGQKMTVPAGGNVILKPGQSITLMPGQYHTWQGIPGTGDVVLFEVSSVNDDRVDNRFHRAVGRLPEIVEDEPAKYLIFNDYCNLDRHKI